MGLNVTGTPLEFEAVLNLDNLDVQIAALNKKLQTIASAAIDGNKAQEQSLATTIAGYKELTTVTDKVETAFESVAKAQVATFKETSVGVDKSTQDLKEYLTALDEFNKQGTKVPVNQRAPDGATTQSNPINVDQPIEGIDLKLLEDGKKLLEDLDNQTKKYIGTLASEKQRLSEIQIAQKALSDQLKAGTISKKQFAEASTQLAAAENESKESIRAVLTLQAQSEKQNSTETTAITAKREALRGLIQEYENLSIADRDDVNIGGKMRENFTSLKGELKTLTLDNLNQSAQKTVSAFAQLRQLKQQIAAADPNSAGLQDMLLQAGQLRNQLDDANDVIKTLGSDTPGLNAAVSGLRGVIGGFTAVSGLIGIFNDDNSETQETIQRVTSAMAVLNGVQEIAQVLDKAGALNQFLLTKLRLSNATATAAQATTTVALSGATGVQAVATGAATRAQVGLNAAMLANPAAVLLLAVTAIIVAYQVFSDSAEDAAKKQTELNNALAEANKTFSDIIDLQIELQGDKVGNAQRALDLATAQGKSENEILGLRRNVIAAEREIHVQKLALFNTEGKSLEIRKQELVLLQKIGLQFEINAAATAKRGGSLNDIQKAKQEEIKSRIEQAKAIIDIQKTAEDGIIAADAALQTNLATSRKKAVEDSLKSQSALAQARVIQAQKDSASELIAIKGSLQTRSREELANVNLTAGERLRINAQLNKDLADADRAFSIASLDREQSRLQARLNQVREGSEEELAIQVEALNNRAKAEIIAAQNNADKIEEIKSKAAKQIDTLTKSFLDQSSQDTSSTNIAIIEGRLAAVTKGTEKELELRKRLSVNKEALEVSAANATIKNEELLASTLLRIAAKSTEERLQLDRDYQEQLFNNRITRIEGETRAANIGPNQTIDDPTATAVQKRAAADLLLQNQRANILRQLQATETQLAFGVGNTNKLIEKRVELYLELLELSAEITNSEKNNRAAQLVDINDKVQQLTGAFSSLATAIGGAGSQAGTAINLIGTALQAATQFATGNFVGAVATVVSSIANIIAGNAAQKKKDREAEQAFQSQIFTGEVEINALYRQRALEQVRINSLRTEGIVAEKKLLEAQKLSVAESSKNLLGELQKLRFKATNTEIVAALGFGASSFESRTLGSLSLVGKTYEDLEKLFRQGRLEGRAKELFETLQKLKAEGVDIDKQIKSIEIEANERFTGTTASGIADSIIEGFKNGFKSAQDFAGGFEELMRNAIINSLKYNQLEKPLNAFYEAFATDAKSGGELTAAEIAALQEMYNKIIGDASTQFDQLKQIAGVNFNSSATASNTLTGSFKTLSEDTGNLLAGQFGGLRLTALDTLKIATESLRVHQNIEANTGRTVLRMDSLLQKFDAYETGAKSLKVAI